MVVLQPAMLVYQRVLPLGHMDPPFSGSIPRGGGDYPPLQTVTAKQRMTIVTSTKEAQGFGSRLGVACFVGRCQIPLNVKNSGVVRMHWPNMISYSCNELYSFCEAFPGIGWKTVTGRLHGTSFWEDKNAG